MNGPINIRPMLSGDLESVIRLAGALKAAPHWPRSVYDSALAPATRPEHIALVAEDAEAGIAGFILAALCPPEAELESIAVAAGFQRRGLARRLFAALAEDFQARRVSVVFLEVRASNLSAQAFYRSLDFVEAGRRPKYYVDPVEDAILLRLDFPERSAPLEF